MDAVFPSAMLASIPNEVVPVLAVGGGMCVAIVWVLAATIDSIVKTRAREQTRREIAAYVAEGTMAPEDAARILEAGNKAPACGARA